MRTLEIMLAGLVLSAAVLPAVQVPRNIGDSAIITNGYVLLTNSTAAPAGSRMVQQMYRLTPAAAEV